MILDMLFACPMTILGDRAQTLDDKTRDVLTFLPQIFGKKIRRIEMKKVTAIQVRLHSTLLHCTKSKIWMWRFSGAMENR